MLVCAYMYFKVEGVFVTKFFCVVCFFHFFGFNWFRLIFYRLSGHFLFQQIKLCDCEF